MWFKSAPVIFCIYLAVISTGSLLKRHDEILSRKQNIEEGFRSAVLPRGDQPYQNSTGRLETLQVLSKGTVSSPVAVPTGNESHAAFTPWSKKAPSLTTTTQPSSPSYSPRLPLSITKLASVTSHMESDNELSTSTISRSSVAFPYSSTQEQRSSTTFVGIATTSGSKVPQYIFNVQPASSEFHYAQDGPITASFLQRNASFASDSLSISQANIAEPAGAATLTTPTPRLQTQPILSTVGSLSFVISGHAGISSTRQNTIAVNGTSTIDLPLLPNPTPIDISVSTVSVTDSTSTTRINSAVLNGSLSHSFFPGSDSTAIPTQTFASRTLTVIASPTSSGITLSGTLDDVVLSVKPTTPSIASFTAECSLRTSPAQSALGLPIKSTIITNIKSSMADSVINSSSISLSPLDSITRPAGNETTMPVVSTSATTLSMGIMRSAKTISGNTLAAQPTVSSISSQRLPETTKGFFSWTNTSLHSVTELDKTSTEISESAGFFSTFSTTQSAGPDARKSTFIHTTLATVTSVSNGTTPTVFTTSTGFPESTKLLADVGYGITTTPLTAPTSSSTATETAAASPTPPLTTSQTAGVAVGSTAGVLLAIVAAVFIARRYHAKRVPKRWSTGSAYPKVAYLYDPHCRESGSGGSGDDNESALMSGGAGGMLPPESTLGVPENTRDSRQLFSSSSANRYSDSGNPFRDPEAAWSSRNSMRNSLPTPTDAAAALSAAIAGYAMASHWSPETPEFPDEQTFHDSVKPSPTLSPFNSRGQLRRSLAESVHRNNDNSKHAYTSINKYARPSSTPPESPSFEQDFLLLVSSRTETPDSVMLYAAPLPPKSVRQTSPTKLPAKSNSQISPISPPTPNMTPSPTDRFSLAYDSQSSTTYIRPTSSGGTLTHPLSFISPISSPSAPMYKGWEEIKRYSNESSTSSSLVTSPPPSFSPPPRSVFSPPTQKRSLVQLRRKDPVLSGPGQVMMSSTGHPLTVRIPFRYKKGKGFEGPRMSLLAKLNGMGDERGDGLGNPDSTAGESGYSNGGLVRETRGV